MISASKSVPGNVMNIHKLTSSTIVDGTMAARILKIVMVDSHSTIERGGAIQCATLASGLARRGHQITCIFDGKQGKFFKGGMFKQLQSVGVNIIAMPLNNPIGMLNFRHFLNSEQPDIIHTHKNRALFFVYFATLGMDRPPWIANRGTVYPLSRNRIAHYIHKRHLDCIMAVSRAVRNSLLKDHISEEKTKVVYGSFDRLRFHSQVDRTLMRRKWMISENTIVIGLIGSLNTPKKGHPVFLKAGKILIKKISNIKLVIVGEGDSKSLQVMAKSLGIADRVLFAGFIENIPTALAAMDVVVCSSLRGEGLTGAIREAMAMKRPVVSSDVAGNSELVIHDETGLLVPPGDPTALAKAIEKIIIKPQLAKKRADKGYEKVTALCAEPVRLSEVEKIYYSVLHSCLNN